MRVKQEEGEIQIEFTRWDMIRDWFGHHIGCRFGIERWMPYNCAYCYHEATYPLTLDPHEMAKYAMKKGCPVCREHPMQLLEGPGGHGGQNVFCLGCGSRFTMYPLPGHPMMELVNTRELSQETLERERKE